MIFFNMKTQYSDRKKPRSMDTTDDLTAACLDLDIMAMVLGKERAFVRVQCAWPTVTRNMLETMLSYSQKPNATKLNNLIKAFEAALMQS
jgi:hypothetical protein